MKPDERFQLLVQSMQEAQQDKMSQEFRELLPKLPGIYALKFAQYQEAIKAGFNESQALELVK